MWPRCGAVFYVPFSEIISENFPNSPVPALMNLGDARMNPDFSAMQLICTATHSNRVSLQYCLYSD